MSGRRVAVVGRPDDERRAPRSTPRQRPLRHRPGGRMHTAKDLTEAFTLGLTIGEQKRVTSEEEAEELYLSAYEAGRRDEQQRYERLLEQLRRLREACRAAEDGDPGPVLELGRQAAAQDLTEVSVADGGQLAGEVEQWLSGRSPTGGEAQPGAVDEEGGPQR